MANLKISFSYDQTLTACHEIAKNVGNNQQLKINLGPPKPTVQHKIPLLLEF